MGAVPDPVSELSSLDEAGESDAGEDARSIVAETNNAQIDRWNRVRELAAQLVTRTGPVRVRQKISILNAIAQHVAAAENAPPEAIFHELCNIYTRCAVELPDRHKPLMISPIQTLGFALRERDVPAWFLESLESLQKSVSGGDVTIQNDICLGQPTTSDSSAKLFSAPNIQVGEESLDLEDFSIPKTIALTESNLLANAGQNYDPITPGAKIAYIDSCGCATNLYALMASVQTGRIPLNDRASTFLREVAWMESVQSWQDWSADRAYRLAQLANSLSMSASLPSSSAGPTILPTPEKYQHDGMSDFEANARKVRRVESRPFHTTSGVTVVHPVSRAGSSTMSSTRHAGVVGTMWDNPIIRKLIRLDEVQLLYDLREFCLEHSSNIASARGLPRLEGLAEPTNLASHFPIHATGSSKFSTANQDLMCSLCGLVLQTQIVKRTHLKSHLIRGSAVLPFLLGVTQNNVAPSPPPLRQWLEVTSQVEGGLPSPFTRTRVVAEVLDQLMSDERVTHDAHVRWTGCDNINESTSLLQRIPLTTTNLACSSLKNHHSSFACVVCNGVLRPVQVGGNWLIPNVLVGQLHGGSTLKLSLLQPFVGSHLRRKDLESIVAGPRNCEFRQVIGRAYSAARDRSEQCPDKLKSFLSRLLRAIEGDMSKLQILVQAFSREAQQKIMQVAADEGDNASAMLKGCLRAFEYYLDRFANSYGTGRTDEEDMLDQSQETAEGGGHLAPTTSSAGTPLSKVQPDTASLALTSPPGSIQISLSMADAEFLHSRFGQGQLLLHTSCASPFVISTTMQPS